MTHQLAPPGHVEAHGGHPCGRGLRRPQEASGGRSTAVTAVTAQVHQPWRGGPGESLQNLKAKEEEFQNLVEILFIEGIVETE